MMLAQFMLGMTAGGTVAAVGVYILSRFFNNKKTDVQYIDKEAKSSIDGLKNALLTHAMAIVCANDFDGSTTPYAEYNGNALPPLTGYNITNACFSYMNMREAAPEESWRGSIMRDKHIAIQKYLARQLGSPTQAAMFFEAYLTAIAAIESDSESDSSDATCVYHGDHDDAGTNNNNENDKVDDSVVNETRDNDKVADVKDTDDEHITSYVSVEQ